MPAKSSRVNIINKNGQFKAIIRANGFYLGNSALTFCVCIAALANAVVIYMMVIMHGNLSYLIPALAGCVGATAIICRAWLWHSYGKELLEMRGSCLYTRRDSVLIQGKESKVEFNDSTDLYVNKRDKWNWKALSRKGVFRLVSGLDKVDFGIGLDGADYEMILMELNPLLSKYKSKLPSLDKQLNGKHEEKLRQFHEKISNIPVSQTKEAIRQ